MFDNGQHDQIKSSIDLIGASIAIFEKIDQGYFSLVSANQLFMDISAKETAAVLGGTLDEVFPRYIAKALSASLNQCLDLKASIESELVVDRGGVTRWWRCFFSPIITPDDPSDRIILTCVEITEKKVHPANAILAR